MNKSKKTRREFIKKAVLSSAAVVSAPNILTASRSNDIQLIKSKSVDSHTIKSPNDNIQIAVVGAGGMGVQDTLTALQIDGVKLVAACDLYDGRLDSAKS